MALAFGPRDVVKGAEIFVRFNMKHGDGSDAPSEVYGGWVTRVTASDVVWIRFGKYGNTLVFALHHIVDNVHNYFRMNESVESVESVCADTLLLVSREPMMFCIDI